MKIIFFILLTLHIFNAYSTDFDSKKTRLLCNISGKLTSLPDDKLLASQKVFVTIQETPKNSIHITIDGPEYYNYYFSGPFEKKLNDPYYWIGGNSSNDEIYFVIEMSKTNEFKKYSDIKIDRNTGFIRIWSHSKSIKTDYFSEIELTGLCEMDKKNTRKF